MTKKIRALSKAIQSEENRLEWRKRQMESIKAAIEASRNAVKELKLELAKATEEAKNG